MSENFWEDKRVIVTGGSGFLGSFVVEKLKERGAADIFVPRSSEYDLRHPKSITHMLQDYRANMIIHLAALAGGIGANRARPAEFFYDNLMMGVPLLHKAWEHNVDKFVAVGTICSYPKFTPLPFKEDDLWDGYPEETNAPYGLAKKMLLVQSQSYRQQYGYNSIYLMPVNLFGPRDNFDLETSHVIPALIRKCLEARRTGAQEIVCWGDGSPTRAFLYVADAAEGMVLAAERYDGAEPVNLGTAQEVSIRDLVETIARLCRYDGKVLWDASQPNGQPRRSLDISRAERCFGFSAKTPLAEGLAATVKWYEGGARLERRSRSKRAPDPG